MLRDSGNNHVPFQRLYKLSKLLRCDGHLAPRPRLYFHSLATRQIPRIRQGAERQATDRQLHGQDRIRCCHSLADLPATLLRHPRLKLQLVADWTED